MNRVANLPTEDRRELFAMTAERKGLGSLTVVEKDFWVCWTLKRIFSHPELKDKLLFKGGTSLSKAFGLIDRFSEDIDLVLDWRLVTDQDPVAKRSNTKQQALNAEINELAKVYIAETLLGVLNDALGAFCEIEVSDEDDAQGHVVTIHYPKTAEESGFLRPDIQLEIGPLASWLPHANRIIRPYAAEEFPDLFKDKDCPVKVVDAERTFWEKATILHHEANRPDTSIVPSRYSRHYYDLHFMARSPVKDSALRDLDLLHDVVEFKKRFYPRGWARYDLAVPGSFQLIPPDRILTAMRKDYAAMEEMIFGSRPSFEEIITSLSKLENEINALPHE